MNTNYYDFNIPLINGKLEFQIKAALDENQPVEAMKLAKKINHKAARIGLMTRIYGINPRDENLRNIFLDALQEANDKSLKLNLLKTKHYHDVEVIAFGEKSVKLNDTFIFNYSTRNDNYQVRQQEFEEIKEKVISLMNFDEVYSAVEIMQHYQSKLTMWQSIEIYTQIMTILVNSYRDMEAIDIALQITDDELRQQIFNRSEMLIETRENSNQIDMNKHFFQEDFFQGAHMEELIAITRTEEITAITRELMLSGEPELLLEQVTEIVDDEQISMKDKHTIVDKIVTQILIASDTEFLRKNKIDTIVKILTTFSNSEEESVKDLCGHIAIKSLHGLGDCNDTIGIKLFTPVWFNA